MRFLFNPVVAIVGFAAMSAKSAVATNSESPRNLMSVVPHPRMFIEAISTHEPTAFDEGLSDIRTKETKHKFAKSPLSAESCFLDEYIEVPVRGKDVVKKDLETLSRATQSHLENTFTNIFETYEMSVHKEMMEIKATMKKQETYFMKELKVISKIVPEPTVPENSKVEGSSDVSTGHAGAVVAKSGELEKQNPALVIRATEMSRDESSIEKQKTLQSERSWEQMREYYKKSAAAAKAVVDFCDQQMNGKEESPSLGDSTASLAPQGVLKTVGIFGRLVTTNLVTENPALINTIPDVLSDEMKTQKSEYDASNIQSIMREIVGSSAVSSKFAKPGEFESIAYWTAYVSVAFSMMDGTRIALAKMQTVRERIVADIRAMQAESTALLTDISGDLVKLNAMIGGVYYDAAGFTGSVSDFSDDGVHVPGQIASHVQILSELNKATTAAHDHTVQPVRAYYVVGVMKALHAHIIGLVGALGGETYAKMSKLSDIKNELLTMSFDTPAARRDEHSSSSPSSGDSHSEPVSISQPSTGSVLSKSGIIAKCVLYGEVDGAQIFAQIPSKATVEDPQALHGLARDVGVCEKPNLFGMEYIQELVKAEFQKRS